MIQIKQIRHGVRALRAAGISQTDWHPNQILYLPCGDQGVSVVFIDIAFASMYLGDEAGLSVRNDLMYTRCMLRFRLDVDRAALEQYWEEPLKFEY